ncbi:MAG: FkbM family methyltransferase [Chitinophagaceae bacterium]
MSGLYFLGIKKSAIKKWPLIKDYFDRRDRKVYQTILDEISKDHRIASHSSKESSFHFHLKGRELKIIFRHFPSSDISVFNQVFTLNCYKPIMEKLSEAFEPSKKLRIIDAGGNVGYADLFFKVYFPNAEIVSIEPEEGNRLQLEANMAVNDFHLKELIKGGLWHRPVYLEVVRDFRDNREAAFTVRETNNETSIKGYGFEEILQRQGWDEVDLVKIDIEGSERFLFDTNEKADAILSRTRFLAIEIHDEFNIREQIYAHLQRNGFRYFEYDDLTLAINEKKQQS